MLIAARLCWVLGVVSYIQCLLFDCVLVFVSMEESKLIDMGQRTCQSYSNLVGSFNAFQKSARQIGSFPQFSR